MRAMRAPARDEHVDDVSQPREIDTVNRYTDFLVVMFSVGLASARPNY